MNTGSFRVVAGVIKADGQGEERIFALAIRLIISNAVC